MARNDEVKTKAAMLKTVPIFSSCSPKELNAIAHVAKQVDFEAGQIICEEGKTGAGFHIVVQGETKVQVGGRTKRTLGPGAFFGEIALLDGGPRTATVIAETEVRTLAIPPWSFKTLLRSQPGLTLKILDEVCRRVRSNMTSLSH